MALIKLITVHSTHLIAVFFVAAIIYKLLTRRGPAYRRNLRLPPGPPGEPIIGHLRIIPTDNPEYAYANWSKEYGSDVLYFNVLGQDIVVLNSVRAAVDLLDKRGANYCDRPRFVLFEEMGWRKTLTFLRWGPEFRMHRKILQKAFQKTNIQAYHDLQEREARILVEGIIKQPEAWEAALRRYSTAIVMKIGFGVDVKSGNDPYIQMAADASYALGHGGAPAGTLVDFFPFFKHLPDWLIRDRSLRFARDWRWAIRKLHDAPYAAVTAQKTPNDSLIKILLDQRKEQLKSGFSDLSEDDIKGAAGAIYAAGQDTTWSTLVVFVLAMVLHPEIQEKAQKIIEEVVGKERLPSFEDRPRLTFIDYIVQETLRWCPVSPLGVPHRSLEDDIYEGMFIPKKSFVYANARAMTHDETVYSNPEVFNPERYVPVDEGGCGEPFPLGQFGFGRRICVGKYLAEANIWIVVVSMLATLEIGRTKGADGKSVIPLVELTNGLTSHPTRFPCQISPRLSNHRGLFL